MLRLFSCAVVLVAFSVGSLTAAEARKDKKNDNKNAHQAKITKVDSKNGTITVRMQVDKGKTVDKTFKLTEDIRMLDSAGRAAAIEFFKSGDDVLIVEAQGRLKEMRQNKNAKQGKDKSSTSSGKKEEKTITDKKGKDK